MRLRKFYLVFPAKAGTHLTAAPKFSSGDDALLIPRGSRCGAMGPGFPHGTVRGLKAHGVAGRWVAGGVA
jgi:hypothetical protein